MEQMLHYEEGGHPYEDQESHAPVGGAVDLGEEIGGGNVHGYTARERKGIGELALESGREQDS